MGTAGSAAGQRRGVFTVDQTAARAEMKRAGAPGSHHGSTADGGTWSAISSAAVVLSGNTPDAMAARIGAHWQVMR